MYLGTESRVLKHDGRVAELLNQAVFALDCLEISLVNGDEGVLSKLLTCIGDFGNLIRVEAVPTLSSTGKNKLRDMSIKHVGQEWKHTGMIEGAWQGLVRSRWSK